MSLRIRRGTDAQRTSNGGVTFDLGELVYTTDTQKLYVGDGVTAGGKNILSTSAGAGIKFDAATQTLQLDPAHLGLTTSDISEGSNLYYLASRALTAIGNALTAGNAYSHGITFAYDLTAQPPQITATVNGGVITDTSPSLGGNLNLNNHTINGSGSINISGSITASSSIGVGSNLTITGNNLISTQTSSLGPYLNADPQFIIGSSASPNTLFINSSNNFIVNTGVTTGVATAGVVSRMSRGSLASPTALQPNDFCSYYQSDAYDGANYVPVGVFGMAVDPDTTVSSGAVAGLFGAMTLDKTGTQHFMTFNSSGVLQVPAFLAGDGSAAHPSIAFTTDGGKDTGFFHPGDGILCISANAVERVRVDSGGMRVAGFVKVGSFGTLPVPPEAGMIVFDSVNSQFKGYNGTAWVVLG